MHVGLLSLNDNVMTGTSHMCSKLDDLFIQLGQLEQHSVNERARCDNKRIQTRNIFIESETKSIVLNILRLRSCSLHNGGGHMRAKFINYTLI